MAALLGGSEVLQRTLSPLETVRFPLNAGAAPFVLLAPTEQPRPRGARVPSYPKKLFYRIQEVADIVGVETYVLRYWESKFPMVAPEKDGNDVRRYREEDIKILLRIRALLYDERYTIAGAVERMKEELAKGGRAALLEREASIPEDGAPPEPPAPKPTKKRKARPAATDDGADSPIFEDEPHGAPLAGEELQRKLAELRRELGLLKRELEDWRDELDARS